jgi:hypothetical protein
MMELIHMLRLRTITTPQALKMTMYQSPELLTVPLSVESTISSAHIWLN